jgi:hypothetical protein
MNLRPYPKQTLTTLTTTNNTISHCEKLPQTIVLAVGRCVIVVLPSAKINVRYTHGLVTIVNGNLSSPKKYPLERSEILTAAVFHPEDGDSTFLRNINLYTKLYGVTTQKTEIFKHLLILLLFVVAVMSACRYERNYVLRCLSRCHQRIHATCL